MSRDPYAAEYEAMIAAEPPWPPPWPGLPWAGTRFFAPPAPLMLLNPRGQYERFLQEMTMSTPMHHLTAEGTHYLLDPLGQWASRLDEPVMPNQPRAGQPTEVFLARSVADAATEVQGLIATLNTLDTGPGVFEYVRATADMIRTSGARGYDGATFQIFKPVPGPQEARDEDENRCLPVDDTIVPEDVSEYECRAFTVGNRAYIGFLRPGAAEVEGELPVYVVRCAFNSTIHFPQSKAEDDQNAGLEAIKAPDPAN